MVMKWIMVSPGRYKWVGDDDPRPSVKLKPKSGAPNIKFIPSWKKHEVPMFAGDGHTQFDAADKFDRERDHEIKTNPQAARWEKSRKEWFAKQKHNWRQNEMAKLKEKGL